ncbi:unnamed protein product [Brassica napus]|uniref:(rape) hypothetical protein n=1 Tax=Brassica napus TaxID=3708 RepID=A0A816KZN4_BRANA|nr:unnamed protein product [Brassica napus]
MAFNRDLKLKKPIVEDYSYSLEEAFNKGKNETRDRYRAMLFMYQNQLEAITAKHDEEREVYRVQGKLELLKELFKKDARRKEKNKLKTELVLAKEKIDGVKIPYVDWFTNFLCCFGYQYRNLSSGFVNQFNNMLFSIVSTYCTEVMNCFYISLDHCIIGGLIVEQCV